MRVKRKGNFNKLYVVKISENFYFEGKMIDRKDLKRNSAQFASVSYKDMKSDDEEMS